LVACREKHKSKLSMCDTLVPWPNLVIIFDNKSNIIFRNVEIFSKTISLERDKIVKDN
jgi:hypothetical protein